MPREISLTAYEYGELKPLAQNYARDEMRKHLLRTTRMELRETVVKPFEKEYIEPAGFTITDDNFYKWLLSGIRDAGVFSLRFPDTKNIGIVDVHKWGETQNAIIPKLYQKAYITIFHGEYDKDSFYVAPAIKEIETGPEVAERIRRMSKTGITPCFATMVAGLIMIMKERSKELLCEDRLQEELNKHYYAASGRFLCVRETIVETHYGTILPPESRVIMLPATIS